MRTLELLERFIPAPPAVVLDVRGGAGVYALTLAQRGYEVHLLDPIALHVEQARAASAQQADAPLAALEQADARALPRPDGVADAVLLLGPPAPASPCASSTAPPAAPCTAAPRYPSAQAPCPRSLTCRVVAEPTSPKKARGSGPLPVRVGSSGWPRTREARSRLRGAATLRPGPPAQGRRPAAV